MIDIDMVIRRLKVAKEIGIYTYDERSKRRKRSVFSIVASAGPWDRRTLYRWIKGSSYPRLPDAEKLDNVLSRLGF